MRVWSMEMCAHCRGPETEAATRNRRTVVSTGTLAFHLMGPAKAGKTRLLEATQHWLARRGWKMGVALPLVEGDQGPARLAKAGLRVQGLEVGRALHLGAGKVSEALAALDRAGDLDLFFMEDLPDLAWPPATDLGQGWNVSLLPIDRAERLLQSDPSLVEVADLLLVSGDAAHPERSSSLRQLQERMQRTSRGRTGEVLPLSFRTGQGLPEWIAWLEDKKRRAFRQSAEDKPRLAPRPGEEAARG